MENLTYEYALNVFSDYISKNEEYTSITFTEISFEYGMRRTGKRGSLLLFRFRYLELKITIMGWAIYVLMLKVVRLKIWLRHGISWCLTLGSYKQKMKEEIPEAISYAKIILDNNKRIRINVIVKGLLKKWPLR